MFDGLEIQTFLKEEIGIEDEMYIFVDGNAVGNFDKLIAQIKNDNITRILDDNSAF